MIYIYLKTIFLSLSLSIYLSDIISIIQLLAIVWSQDLYQVRLSLYIYLSILKLSLSPFLSILSINQSINLFSFYLTFCWFVFRTFCSFVFLSFFLFVFLSLSLSLFVSSLSLSLPLSIYLSIYIT